MLYPSNIQRKRAHPDKMYGKRGETINIHYSMYVINRTEIFASPVVAYPISPSHSYTWVVSGGTEATKITTDGMLTISQLETAKKLVVKATHIYNKKLSEKTVVFVENPVPKGAASGLIFYDKGMYSNGWRYLEAALSHNEFSIEFELWSETCPITSTRIGSGRENTATIIDLLNANGETRKAESLSAMLTMNGFTDGFIPSKDELNLMYKTLCDSTNTGQFNNSGEFPNGWYWSSSVWDDGSDFLEKNQYPVWIQRFNDGSQPIYYNDSYYQLRVRAVRAF